jgi:hypothetical protein
MRFARYTFLIAGIYGFLALLPQYFLEQRIGTDTPPPITHPEFFYGFIGVGLAFQIAFLIIAWDPLKYRAMILPSIVEKFSFGLAVTLLFYSGRVAGMMFAGGIIDSLFGLLFVASWFKTAENWWEPPTAGRDGSQTRQDP